jgi:cytochrome c peroxidase
MMKIDPRFPILAVPVLLAALVIACSGPHALDPTNQSSLYPDFYAMFGSKIDLANLPNYASQGKPSYITKDNSGSNPISNEVAILGRVLFYDKKLSSNSTVSCSTCHNQTDAFSDSLTVSLGVNGQTGRHSMRLVNSRFGAEVKFFWDERASTLEAQSTQPIQDHNEMGFSGQAGAPSLDELLARLQATGYYRDLFTFAYGSSEITEPKIQTALAQFVRSIQSFDSKYDVGRAQVGADGTDFPNFTTAENAGKRLFVLPPNQGGLGCAGCHRPPEFDIDPNSGNNGFIRVFGSVSETDITVKRSPSLRDVVKPDGSSNGPFMHDGSLVTLDDVVEHYNSGVTANSELDPRLMTGGNPRRLNLTATQKSQLVQFLRTLSGTAVYTDAKWSDPF